MHTFAVSSHNIEMNEPENGGEYYMMPETAFTYGLLQSRKVFNSDAMNA